MKVLHLLRNPADPEAARVIAAEAAQGVDLGLLLLRAGTPPKVDAPIYVIKEVIGEDAPEGATAMNWTGALDLMFAAHTIVTW